MDKIKFDWNDISIVPSTESKIDSRSEINPLYKGRKLPLFVAPMDTVIDGSNYDKFLKKGFGVCAPRHSGIIDSNVFVSIGLKEMEDLIKLEHAPPKVLVDIANGHMSKLMDLSTQFKEKFPDSELMVGNIANPKTFEIYCHIGVDYVRVGIGGGSACFVGDTYVITDNGNKKIKDITTSDKVLTHKGNYKDVLLKHTKKSSDLIKINGNVSTTDHEYYVVNKSDSLLIKTETDLYKYGRWVKSSDLDKEIHLLVKVGDV